MLVLKKRPLYYRRYRDTLRQLAMKKGSFLFAKSSFLFVKSSFLFFKSSFLFVKSSFLFAKISFLFAKSSFLFVKSSFLFFKGSFLFVKSSFLFFKGSFLFVKSSFLFFKSSFLFVKSSLLFFKSSFWVFKSSFLFVKSSFLWRRRHFRIWTKVCALYKQACLTANSKHGAHVSRGGLAYCPRANQTRLVVGVTLDSATIVGRKRRRLLISLSAGLPMWGAWCKTLVGGLFSRRMGAPVSQTNAAGGSVQYSWGSGGRCKPTSGVRKRTHFGNNVYKICFK